MKRLQEIRLPDAVRADREHEAGPEGHVEPLVRSKVRECELLDDQALAAQPGRRIGITR